MELSKGKQILLIAALLSANIAVMGDNAIYPIIANIYGAFPDQIGLVNYIVFGPLFVIFVVSLFASNLFRYFSKKVIMVFGGILFAASSILGVAVENIYYIMAMRTIYGISMVILFLLFLPNMKSENETQTGSSNELKEKKEPYSLQFWITIVIVALVTLCFNIVANFSSTYVAEHQLGNTATAGIVSSVCTLGSMVFSFLFGGLYGKFKKNLLAISSIMLAAAFAMLYFTSNLYITFVSMFIMGGAYGIALAFSYGHGTILAPTRMDDAIGIATAAYAIAGFASTYAATGMMQLMSTNLITPVFVIPMIGAVIITIVYPLLTAKQGK